MYVFLVFFDAFKISHILLHCIVLYYITLHVLSARLLSHCYTQCTEMATKNSKEGNDRERCCIVTNKLTWTNLHTKSDCSCRHQLWQLLSNDWHVLDILSALCTVVYPSSPAAVTHVCKQVQNSRSRQWAWNIQQQYVVIALAMLWRCTKSHSSPESSAINQTSDKATSARLRFNTENLVQVSCSQGHILRARSQALELPGQEHAILSSRHLKVKGIPGLQHWHMVIWK